MFRLDQKPLLVSKFFSNILDMKYGIENECKAIAIYSSQTGNKFVSSGLWINAKYLHLGASPHGLILDDSFINVKGVIEVKCLKFFAGRSIEQIIQQKLPELSRQCFKVVDNKILLKTSHAYYYEIQLQCFVTEAEYCNFALYSDIGKRYIQRIFKDKDLQYQIIAATKIFWRRVLIPEYFLMRIPRELLPFIL